MIFNTSLSLFIYAGLYFAFPLSISLMITGDKATLLANSKLMISPDDAIKSAFDIHARIQAHVGQFQNIQFAAKIENCFTERPPEVEHD